MKKIAIIWLWYVWLPLAYHFSLKWHTVLWFDISTKKLEDLRNGIDDTDEIGPDIAKAAITYTNVPDDLKQVDIIIVTVPTPINESKSPDFVPLEKASEMIGKVLQKGQIVVYESTVYPGCTEDICLPLLQKNSWLEYNQDFFLGYSPERIVPGDKNHQLTNIAKVVSGSTPAVMEELALLYGEVTSGGIHKAPSIKVAEASKIVENTQRDVNIAIMNEFSQIFNKMNLNTYDVLEAAGTKRNFLKFMPGLVGGHCIWVDPYRLAYKAGEVGHNPAIILASRRTNDETPLFVANQVVKMLINAGKKVKWAKVLVLGLTFKENVPDFRNSKIADTIKELKSFGTEIYGHDPYSHHLNQHILDELNLSQSEIITEVQEGQYDAVIYATTHKEYVAYDFDKLLNENGVIYDIKGIRRAQYANHNFYRTL